MKVVAIFSIVGLYLTPLPARANDTAISPERLASEKCVWDYVEARRALGGDVGDIDAQIAIGNDAVDACDAYLRAWAEASPAVLEGDESVEDVLALMQTHYVARGALLASGRAQPFHEERPLP